MLFQKQNPQFEHRKMSSAQKRKSHVYVLTFDEIFFPFYLLSLSWVSVDGVSPKAIPIRAYFFGSIAENERRSARQCVGENSVLS